MKMMKRKEAIADDVEKRGEQNKVTYEEHSY
jgi:hypothetical protein